MLGPQKGSQVLWIANIHRATESQSHQGLSGTQEAASLGPGTLNPVAWVRGPMRSRGPWKMDLSLRKQVTQSSTIMRTGSRGT